MKLLRLALFALALSATGCDDDDGPSKSQDASVQDLSCTGDAGNCGG